MYEVFSTAGVPARDRFACWREAVVSESTMLVTVRTRYESDFLATAKMTAFGGLSTIAVDNPPVEVDRTASLIRRSDPGAYHLILTANDRQEVSQDRRVATLGRGDMVLYHTSRPLRTRPDPRIVRQRSVLVAIPDGVLGLPSGALGRLIATRLPSDDRVGSLVAAYVRALATGAGPVPAEDAAALYRTTLDLILVMLARRLDAARQVPVEARENALLAQVQSFGLAHLGERALAPATIAAAHHMSVRTLHRLFRANGLTVNGWIRARRLERCCRDLLQPPTVRRGLPATPVSHARRGRLGLAAMPVT